MALKQGDFVEIDYIGRIKETNEVFDVTNAEIAKQHHIYNPKAHYHSQIICVGEQQVVPGLDRFLVDKELKTYTVPLSPEEAFGKKDPKLMRLLPLAHFHKEKINPFPGLQLNLNGMLGIVRTVSGGRVIVDFNHPLAGRNVVYEITIKRMITKDEEKLRGLLHALFQKEISCSLKEGKAMIELSLPEQMHKQFTEHIKRLIPAIKEVSFSQPAKHDKKPASK
ncbi:FKBP-type peptidyl-prolyl cis-trans isomerase [Candidatus Woesearchaeota archaeon]|nr:FKBP-type peptidyl-prolyl cis-trans isomerase [Candidatus Woesearchaeota archaeon]